jgi:hypothetical protein
MSQTWKHPQLGTFKLNDRRDCWLGACSLPAFNVFNWELQSAKAPTEYDLVFDGTEDHKPSMGEVMIALRVIASQAHLPSMVASTLWEEFNGRGLKSGMWWYGGMDEVAKNFECGGRSTPTVLDDLLPVMRFNGVWVRESLYEYKNPIVELAFSALFEEEHGVGILTDGSTILGTGYACDVSPYEIG